MPPNVYTWTCPRCTLVLSSGAPTAPENCPRCNFPDAPTVPVPNDPNAELEAERGPEDAWTPAQADPTTDWSPSTTTFVHSPKIDRPWMAECMAEIIAPYVQEHLVREPNLPGAEHAHDLDWAGLTDGVVDRYEGERPMLLCGCLAGAHGKSMEALLRAHPERVP